MSASSACVDFHLHLGESRDGGALSYEQIQKVFDDYPVSHAVLFPIDEPNTGPSYATLNDRIAEIARTDKRIIGFCRLTPHDRQAAFNEMKRCQQTGLRGIKFHPRSEDFSPPHAEGLIAQAEQLRMPIIIHTSHEAHCRPLTWKKLFVRHSKIPFVLAHGGKDVYRQASEIAAECPNVFLDTTTLSYNRTRNLFKWLGPEKIIFGSDMPYSHVGIELLKFDLILQDNQAARRLVFEENARKVLGDLP